MTLIQEFGFANIGRNYKTKKAARDNILRCKNAAPLASWGFVEIDGMDPADEHAIINHVFPARAYTRAGMTRQQMIVTAQPTSKVENKRVIVRSSVKGCDGIPRWMGDRYISEMVITDKGFDSPVAHLVTHFPRHRSGEPDKAWDKLYKKLQERINYWHGRDYTCVITIDANDPDENKFKKALHPKARILVNAGIDYIIIVPAEGVKTRKLNVKKVDLNIDSHNAHVVRVRID